MTHNWTQAEKKLIMEGWRCLMKGSSANLAIERNALYARADEIKKKLGFKKYKEVITMRGEFRP